MKKNFNTRLCNDLFPEMPQSFMDGLQNAMKKADMKPRKHVLRKILIGASAAVLAAACALIVIFGVFVRNRKHTAAVPPASEESTLVGIWTLTRVEMRTESTVLFGVETEKWGDITDQIDYESWLEFTADGYVTLTTYFPDMGEALHNSGSYTVSGDTVTAEWRVPLVTGEEKDVSLSMRYDAESDTICTDSGHRREYYARTPDAVIPSGERKEIAALRTQYPEYFDLDTGSGLKVFVSEFACDAFSCALISGKDKDRTLFEISTMNGTTVSEMKDILSTYDIPSEKIEVIPYVNPLSSYAYNIDELYTSYVTWKIKGGLPYLDAVQFDLDGDGREELITLTYGPTSGLFTVTFSVYRDGKLLAMNTFNLPYGELKFEKSADGLKLHLSESQNAMPLDPVVYIVSVQNGRIVWTNEKTGKAFTDYWGDESWNLNGRDPASIDTSGVTGSSRYLCVGATAGGRIVQTPWEYLSEVNGLEAVGADPENAADGFVWVRRTYITSVPDGQPKLAWGSLAPSESDAPSALRLETELTAENGEPIVLHFALCDQPMEYGFFDEGIADAGPRLKEPTAETLFVADWDEDGIYEFLAYLMLPETRECLISDGERTLVLSDCVSVRAFYTDLDTKSPFGNLILSIETADGSERVYELHPEGDAIVIGNMLNGCCFVDDGTLTEDEPYDLCIGEPSPFGSAHGYYTVHGDALEPWGHYRVALEISDFGVDVQKDRDQLIQKGLLLKLVRDLPCTISGEDAKIEAGTYVYLVDYLDTLTEATLSAEGGLVVRVTMNGDANDLRIDGVPLAEYFDNAPQT